MQAARRDRLAIVLGLWLAVAVIYWPSSEALNLIWRGSAGNTYTHGYLVLIASLWLVIRDRARLEATPSRPVGWAWLVVLLLSALWLWSWRSAIQVVHVLLLPAILLAALVAALGWRIARISLFPIGLLLFAIPIWGAVNNSLLSLMAIVNGWLLWLSGLPAYMQGDLIRLPGGTIEIAQACTGLNGFVIGLTLAALYGEIARDPVRRRLIWLGLMGALALLANAARIFIVTVAAYESDMRSSLVEHHIWLGWCLFITAVAAFLLISDRLARRWDRGRSRGAEPAAGWRPAIAPQASTGEGFSIGRLAVALLCLGSLPTLAYGTDALRSNAAAGIAIRWPSPPEGWRGPMPDSGSEWSPRFVNPSAQSQRRYVDAREEPVEVFAVAYRVQTQDGKLLGYRNDLLGTATHREPRPQIVDSPVGRWRETVAVDASGFHSVIWWRYRIGSREFVEPRLAQLWYGLVALTDSPPISSLTALRMPCSADCDTARKELAAAAVAIQPDIARR
jgi:exosortase